MSLVSLVCKCTLFAIVSNNPTKLGRHGKNIAREA
jgi:hypothetical protein